MMDQSINTVEAKSTRERILGELISLRGHYLSGERLCDKYGISRAAVHKHVCKLKETGFQIETSTKKGYKLTETPGVINRDYLTSILKTKFLGHKIILLDEVDSTNNYAKKLAANGCAEGTIVIAEAQSAGKGRLGRFWLSSGRKGIWMSIVFRPSIEPEKTQLITLAASAAVASAIKKITGVNAGIKWPNDLLLDGRKVCGILTEMSSDMDNIHYVITGIGLNVSQSASDFGEVLAENAISLEEYINRDNASTLKIDRNVIVAEILYHFEDIYSKIINGRTAEIIDVWKRFTLTIARPVTVTTFNGVFEGTAVDIAADGKLVVECHDGITREFNSGEVTLRKLK